MVSSSFSACTWSAGDEIGDNQPGSRDLEVRALRSDLHVGLQGDAKSASGNTHLPSSHNAMSSPTWQQGMSASLHCRGSGCVVMARCTLRQESMDVYLVYAKGAYTLH